MMEKKAVVVGRRSLVGVLEDYFQSEEETTDSDSPSVSKSGSLWRGFVKLLRNKPKKPSNDMSNNHDFNNYVKPKVHPLGVLKLSMRRSSSLRENTDTLNSKSPRMIFTFSELQAATNNFSPENRIGKGGYAEVYKGRLPDGKLVAVKRLIRGTADDIINDFLSELGIMPHVNHPNTAKLVGYGVEGGMHIVLELSPRGSLASLLFASKETLTWGLRYKIALGTAEGIRYLHEGCRRRIVHRDIKASNILLTIDFEPQICDFGLAKWLPEHWTHLVVSKFEGTFGYLAPEYFMHGIVEEKTDVYAFGVLLLELVTGRRALDYTQKSLVLWAKPLLKRNEVRELVDQAIIDDYNTAEMTLVLLAASLCIQHSSISRPTMTQVVQILKGDISSLKHVQNCRVPSVLRRALREEGSG